MAEYKRQHYVPKLILRRFSKDGVRIGVVVLGSGQRIEEATLSAQCYGNYFYGTDLTMEKAFASSEAEFASIIGDLSNSRLESLNADQLEKAQDFLYWQRQRTPGFAEGLSDQFEALHRGIMVNAPGGPMPGWDLVRVRLNRPQDSALWIAATMSQSVRDLRVKFLTASGRRGFIVSDDPVVCCNQYVEHHPELRRFPGATGLLVKGLQMFLPLSPRVCLALYDPTTYQYGDARHLTLEIGSKDVRTLNLLQCLHANECIYYDDRCAAVAELEYLRTQYVRHAGWREPMPPVGPLTELPDGRLANAVAARLPELRLGLGLTFARVIERRRFCGNPGPWLPPRSLEIFARTIAFADGMARLAREKAKAASPA